MSTTHPKNTLATVLKLTHRTDLTAAERLIQIAAVLRAARQFGGTWPLTPQTQEIVQ